MTHTLLSTVSRYADTHADDVGIAHTPIPGVMMVRQTEPTEIDHAIFNPLVALVVQGSKHVTIGKSAFDFGAGDSLLVTADVPTLSQVTRASQGKPYYSLVVNLDLATISELALEMNTAPERDRGPVRVEPTDTEVADAALRLVRLLDRPQSLPILQPQLLREFHYWLLAGRHGPAIRRLGWPEGHVQRIARAVAILRQEFAQPIRTDRLAAAAGMSLSSFHQHFRAVTTLSPLQFQKQLRLIEARRLMLLNGATSSNAAYTVGYESVSQFTREYARMFGMPPVRDTVMAKTRARSSPASP